MTKELDAEEFDIEASISNIDTDMGLDMDYDGDFVTDYHTSCIITKKMDNKIHGKYSTVWGHNPDDLESLKDPTNKDH